jgi:hypothetical protein
MNTNEAKAEQELRWIIWKLSPARYAKIHAEEVLEHLYSRPTEEEKSNARVSQ